MAVPGGLGGLGGRSFNSFFQGGFMSGIPSLSFSGGPALATSDSAAVSHPVMSNDFVFGGSGAGQSTGTVSGGGALAVWVAIAVVGVVAWAAITRK